MGMRLYAIILLTIIATSSLFADEIVIGVDYIPINKKALLFTPISLPNLLSAQFAFEYRLNPKLNLVVPLEAKWMNYRWALDLVDKELMDLIYAPGNVLKSGWNFNYSHMMIATGFGFKIFPFSQSMTNAFFIKNVLLAGLERFNAFSAEGIQYGAVITTALTAGYSWVKANFFTFGFEIGGEHTFHANPIKKFPSIFGGLSPLLNFHFGFVF